MNLSDLLSFFDHWVRPPLDILLLAWLLYKTYKLLIKTQAIQLVRGGVLLAVVYAVAYFLNLSTLLWILNLLAPGLVIALAIIFQPELRKIFIKLGQGRFFMRGRNPRAGQIEAILHAAEILAEKRRGALIAFSRYVSLDELIERATVLDSELSSSLLLSIFEFDTPLHDGGVIIRNGRIVAAGCFFPLSQQKDIKQSFGSRHRAALGLTEEADAVVLVVSEETGALSLAYDAKLYYNLEVGVIRKRLVQLIEDGDASILKDGNYDAE
ncbi:MAG: TIGR00159 family protein [Spirochaetes bacterium GWD1_61_31]|nr:MAG: TIGR00159 family protein [Spirochaetes bacterium GWB1_60_80]OHD34741.1 MAG: TIGR00159 family protein [Spirochaetes bacterium GWC1_61_12]OHD38723.1 MAG: TIGR00159 family protein [Spirochaetes bacterium GWD1_61_31]OHD44468.1 MAG: TIGR00159 family protein [Spirochaetes bacterium GWE1_60_18]OHD59382.1 MAG: TIGR00159 family protein [Spirochaetes bacterium GWF1_60_12]